MNRRKFVKRSMVGSFAMAMPVLPSFNYLASEMRFGVAQASYVMRSYRNIASELYPPFKNSLDMIAHCSSLGFGGVQTGINGWDKPFAKKVRKRAEILNIFLEGQVGLPKTEKDVLRFENEISAAKEAGVEIVRTACLSGRRYETFDSMEAYQKFKMESIASLQLAEPIVRKHKIKLAVENHKDWRIDEMLKILGGIDSEWIGVTLDTGNNISLLEDPMEVVQKLAPYSFSVHLKDMAVEEYEDGFLLSEVNLGSGYLDIEGMIKIIRKHNPDIRFNLEMITRDPLEIPCLTEKYWATFDQISAKELGRYLHHIRAQKSKDPLPRISNKTEDEQLALEVENNRTSLNFAKQHYGFR
jgi:sugar phosphate isomerase/epimerase